MDATTFAPLIDLATMLTLFCDAHPYLIGLSPLFGPLLVGTMFAWSGYRRANGRASDARLDAMWRASAERGRNAPGRYHGPR